jgi:hypothetical protein
VPNISIFMIEFTFGEWFRGSRLSSTGDYQKDCLCFALPSHFSR